MDSSRSCTSTSSACSDSTDASASSGSPGCSPRPAAAAPPPAQPARRVPPLSLRANLAELPRDDGCAAQGTARQHSQPQAGVPSLAMPPPASARGARPAVPSLALPAAAPAPAAAVPPPAAPSPSLPAPSSQAALLSLDILSPAFAIDGQQQPWGRAASGAPAAEVAQRCASRLGVAPARVRVYALTEVAGPQQLPPGCSRAAVEVLDSRFSLDAIEQLLAENQRLASAAARQQQQRQASSAGAADQQVGEQLRKLQLENEALRQRLQRSESLRRQGRRELAHLQEEFNALSWALIRGSSSGSSALEYAELQKQLLQPPATTDAPTGTPAGTPAAVDSACLS